MSYHLYFFPQQTTNALELIYKYKLGLATFNFYINSTGKLFAESIRANIKKVAITIKGIPQEWQENLLNPERLGTLNIMLGQSFFSDCGYTIYVHPRGLGGWEGGIHFVKTSQWASYYVKSDGALGPKMSRRDFIMGKGLSWSTDEITLCRKCKVDAAILAKACKDVDSGNTAPTRVRHPEAQGWHFNCGSGEGGNRYDTRVQHAINRLYMAISKRNNSKREGKKKKRREKYEKSLQTLGTGLHALQDIFAHADAFIIVNYTFGICFFSHGLIPNEADNPKFIHYEYSLPI